MSSTRRLALSLYRELLREAEKLPSYNFRMYACRKVRDSFRANRMINDFEKIDYEILVAKQNLELLRRQKTTFNKLVTYWLQLQMTAWTAASKLATVRRKQSFLQALYSTHIKVIIGHLYTSEKLVIERKKTLHYSED